MSNDKKNPSQNNEGPQVPKPDKATPSPRGSNNDQAETKRIVEVTRRPTPQAPKPDKATPSPKGSNNDQAETKRIVEVTKRPTPLPKKDNG